MKKIFILSLAALPLFAAAQVPSYVPANGLVGWWPFNGNANDESGNGNNGTVNGATLTTDRNGNVNAAYSFDGVNDNIDVADNVGFGFLLNNSYTVNHWVFLNNTTGTQNFIGQGDGEGQYQNRFWRSYLNQGNYKIHIRGNGSDPFDTYCTSPVQSTGQWVMMTMVRNYNSNLVLYINGIQVMSQQDITGSASNFTQTRNILFGCFFDAAQNSNSNFLNGSLDDIGIWNRALTPCEIQALHNSGNNGLTLTTSATNLCVSDGSATLLALPSGGTWSGTGVTGNAFNPAVSGAGTFYAVYTVTNASGCVVSDSLAITVDLCTGITENASSSFTVYPNPANNNITVSWSTVDIKTLTLRDAAGRVVRTYNVNGTQAQLSLEGLASGVYFLSVGEDTKAVQRIVKQ